MKTHSLKFRLIGAAIVSITSALLIYWISLTVLFERHVTRLVIKELNSHLHQLTAAIKVPQNREIHLSKDLADPRFSRPFSGLYWQLEEDGKATLTSRSLWDQTISLSSELSTPGLKKVHNIVSFGDSELIAIERSIVIGPTEEEKKIRLVVAINRKDISQARDAFSQEVLLLVALLAFFLLIAAGAQIFVGLRPLDILRKRLNFLRSGEKTLLVGNYPSEVQLLVNELNDLLISREKAMEKARQSASDLAHALKTPLAILAAESHSLKDQGLEAPATEINEQAMVMSRHIERQLAKTRARGLSGALTGKTQLKPAICSLIETLKRLPEGDHLKWAVEIPDDTEIKFDPMDFNEIAGNILDNARKWADSRVTVSVLALDNQLQIIFQDDGPGVPEQEIAGLTKRGGRLDQNKPGSGLGLAIVSDILDVYSTKLQIKNATPNGLLVIVILET